MPNVRMPDGTVVGFPDDMPRDQIKGMISQKFPHLNGPQGEQQQSWMQRTISNIPESAASVWEGMKHPERDIEAAAQAGTATGEYLKSRWKDPSQIPGDIGRLGSAIVGGIENLPQTVEKDPVGAAVNVGLMAVSPEGAAGRALGIAGKAPEAEKFLAAGGKEIEAAKASTQEFPRQGIVPYLTKMEEQLKKEDYDPKDHPLVSKALKRINKDLAPKPATEPGMISKMAPTFSETFKRRNPQIWAEIQAKQQAAADTHTFRELNKVRKSKAMKEARKSPNDTEAMLAHTILDHLDDYEESLGPIGKMSQKGRDLYYRGKQLEKIQRVEEKARRRARRYHYGLPHARAIEFEKIAGNENRLRTFSPDVQERIKRAGAGGTTTEWLANKAGRFAIRSPVGAALELGVLGRFLPASGAELAVGGEVGRVVERLSSNKALRELKNLIAVGGDEGKLARFATMIGPKVADDFASIPGGRRAISAFINKPTSKTARVVSVMLAKRLNRPDLVPRIQQELENMDQDNNGRTDSVTPTVAPTR